MRDLELHTAPTAALVTLAQVKAHLRLDGINDFDALLTDHLASAIGELDGYAGTLGRALAEQTWILYLDGFPRSAIGLPLPPLLGVDSIVYVDADGAEQTLATDQYQVLAGERAEVRPAHGLSWPSARVAPRAVAITFRCGWAAPEGDEPWPSKLQPVISAVLLKVEELFSGADPIRQANIARLLRKLKLPRT